MLDGVPEVWDVVEAERVLEIGVLVLEACPVAVDVLEEPVDGAVVLGGMEELPDDVRLDDDNVTVPDDDVGFADDVELADDDVRLVEGGVGLVELPEDVRLVAGDVVGLPEDVRLADDDVGFPEDVDVPEDARLVVGDVEPPEEVRLAGDDVGLPEVVRLVDDVGVSLKDEVLASKDEDDVEEVRLELDCAPARSTTAAKMTAATAIFMIARSDDAFSLRAFAKNIYLDLPSAIKTVPSTRRFSLIFDVLQSKP